VQWEYFMGELEDLHRCEFLQNSDDQKKNQLE